MAVPLCGRFDYVVTVPKSLAEHNGWEVRLLQPVEKSGNDLHDRRLVGYAPRLQIADAGLTPDPSPRKPAVMRSRLTLTASNREDATVSAFSFHVDSALTSKLQPGDELYLARTGCAGLGISIVRGKKLIAAVGAITAVPLGSDVQARIPFDLLEKARKVFTQVDPEFRFFEEPIELTVGPETRVLWHEMAQMGGYEVRVEHGFLDGIPGTDECAALVLKGSCSPSAANLSAQLLDLKEGEMTNW